MTSTQPTDNISLNQTSDADALNTIRQLPEGEHAVHSDASTSTLSIRTSADPNTLYLEQILTDTETPWQVHNCKIIDKIITQDEKLPFIYHYDALSEEIKATKLLTNDLLKQFQVPMYAAEAAQLLNLDPKLIPTPWQVKLTGTLVMFCERLQLAMRLKLTNTAKAHDPIYSQTADEALKLALSNWRFYGDVFVLNKGSRPLVMTLDDDWLSIPSLDGYQLLPAQYSLATLTLLEQQKQHLPQLTEAIQLRLG